MKPQSEWTCGRCENKSKLPSDNLFAVLSKSSVVVKYIVARVGWLPEYHILCQFRGLSFYQRGYDALNDSGKIRKIFQIVFCWFFFSLTRQLAFIIIISVNICWSNAEVKAIIIQVSLEPDCISDKRSVRSQSHDSPVGRIISLWSSKCSRCAAVQPGL